jgi:hypothetical protein
MLPFLALFAALARAGPAALWFSHRFSETIFAIAQSDALGTKCN